MEDEQARTVEALQFAMQMEIDGKQFYQKASQKSDNKVGKELFKWLASEEDKHRQRFEEIYKGIKSQRSWPDIEIRPAKREALNTIFSKATKDSAATKGAPAELAAIATAMEMENNTGDFYQSQGNKATKGAEKKFYETLATEERGHYLALVDYREYLIDPAGWLRKAEHHSLDGG